MAEVRDIEFASRVSDDTRSRVRRIGIKSKDDSEGKPKPREIYDIEFRRNMIEDCNNWLDSIDPNEENIYSINVAKSMLEYVQEDTLFEYKALANIFSQANGERLMSYRLARPSLVFPSEDQGKVVVAILLSNLFNREDEKIEIALKASKNMKLNSDEIFEKVFSKGVAALSKEDGNLKRVSPEEAIEHIKKIAKLAGVNTEMVDIRLKMILSCHKKGLSMINRDGDIRYSVDDALDYRIGTIGAYLTMLAEVVLGTRDQENISLFTRSLMGHQSGDDMLDARRDVLIQPNPYLALMKEKGLLEKFVKSGNSVDVFVTNWSFLRNPINFLFADDTKKDIMSDIRRIAREYENCDLRRAIFFED